MVTPNSLILSDMGMGEPLTSVINLGDVIENDLLRG